MDQNNGLEARIFKNETRTSVTIDLGEVPLMPTKISLQDPTLRIGITTLITEDHMTNAQVSHSIETMETDLEMDPPTIRMGTGETMETFPVLHRLKGETSRRIIRTANQEVISPATLLSADVTIDPQLVLHPTNKDSHKPITRPPLTWFGSPQPTMLLTNYQMSAR